MRKNEGSNPSQLQCLWQKCQMILNHWYGNTRAKGQNSCFELSLLVYINLQVSKVELRDIGAVRWWDV